MKNFLSILFFLNAVAFAIEISEPSKIISADSNVISSNLIDEILYLGTDAGTVNIYDIKADKFLPTINLPKKKSYFNDEPSSRVFSIDRLGDMLLILSELSYDERRLMVYKFDGLKFNEIKSQIILNQK